MSDYQPIACHLHDEFEIAIMRAQQLTVELAIDGEWVRADILPIDTKTSDGEEYLLYLESTDTAKRSIRLDRVRFMK